MLTAFHGDPDIKDRYLARVRAHRVADELIHGTYWQDGKGCAVGCTIHSGDHSAYEHELGIPETIAHLEDSIFEEMHNGDSQTWPERFLESIQPGADLSLVWPRFAIWLLSDPEHGVIRFAGARLEVADAIARVSALYRSWVETGTRPSSEHLSEAAWAAGAARAAAMAAEAAWAAGAARAAAMAAAWKRMAAKLLELLASAPLAETAQAT